MHQSFVTKPWGQAGWSWLWEGGAGHETKETTMLLHLNCPYSVSEVTEFDNKTSQKKNSSEFCPRVVDFYPSY